MPLTREAIEAVLRKWDVAVTCKSCATKPCNHYAWYGAHATGLLDDLLALAPPPSRERLNEKALEQILAPIFRSHQTHQSCEHETSWPWGDCETMALLKRRIMAWAAGTPEPVCSHKGWLSTVDRPDRRVPLDYTDKPWMCLLCKPRPTSGGG